jgi:hypothetical protein
MEFVTIHDLSRELDVSARVIRYHLTGLIVAGMLKNEEDYRKENFKDALHFEWKVNPVSFMRESGLKPKNPIPKLADETVNDSITTGNKPGNEPITKPDGIVNEPPPSVTKPLLPANGSVDQSKEIISLHREMIDTLKEQVHVKDEQIRDLSKQNRDTNELNLKLNGALLRQGSEIKKLLQLTGGKMEMADGVNKDPAAVNKTVNQDFSTVSQSEDETNANAEPIETAMAA